MSYISTNTLITKSKVILFVYDFDFSPESVFRSKAYTIGDNVWQIIIDRNLMLEGYQEPMFVIKLKLKSGHILSVRFDSFIYDSNMRKVYQFLSSKFTDLEQNCNLINDMMTSREFMAHKELYPNNDLKIGLIIVESKNVFEECQPCIGYRMSFNVKELNDLHIICGNKEFFVSKAVLTSHSEVFERMFAIEMSEQKTNQFIIEDIDGEVFEEFLKFIYFGNSNKLEELKVDLLIVADKYQVLDVKGICENLMYIELCTSNAIELLLTFDKYNCNKSVVKVIDYISNNLWKIRKKNPNQWRELIVGHNQLIDRITERMSELIEFKSKSKSRRKKDMNTFLILTLILILSDIFV